MEGMEGFAVFSSLCPPLHEKLNERRPSTKEQDVGVRVHLREFFPKPHSHDR